MIKLSIIIPAYNVEEYIEKCIDSCLNQDISKDEYEIIIVNDGSTDKTTVLVDEIFEKNKNITVLNKVNGGQSSARNLGFKNALGTYIWFVDSDDFISKNCLNSILLEMDKGLDMLWFDHILVDENNDVLEKPIIDRKEGIVTATMNGPEFLTKVFKQSCMPCMFVFRNDFLKNNNIFFYEGIYMEDMLFTPIAIDKAERIKYLNLVAYNYLIRSNSTMRDQSKQEKRIEDSLVVARELKKYYIENISLGKLKSITYFEDIICSIVQYNLRRSIKDCSSSFSKRIYSKACGYGLLPIKSSKLFKSKIFCILLNSSYPLYRIICKILK